jgi:intracellular septation protein A
MKNFLTAGKFLLLDMASTLVFLILYSLTRSIPLAVTLGMALGLVQIGREIVRKKPIDTMQWVSLAIVVSSGSATLITNDPRFMMLKLSLIYLVVGTVMLKRGWQNRYLPAIALDLMSDIAVIFGFVWAGLMFLSALVNAIVALTFGALAWASFMSAYGIVSKFSLFLVQYGVMRTIGARRRRARETTVAIA